jgi:DNA polymerase III epsilon subunit-like protein
LVWPQLRAVIGEVPTIVAFRAEFDRAALLTAAAHHNIRLPRLRFVCAAALAHARLGRSTTLAEALELLEIPYPGKPHEPLADARAAALVALACRPPRLQTDGHGAR